METRREDNTPDETDGDYDFEYVSDKFCDEIEERCLNQNLWSTKEEYKEKWKKQFPEKAKEIDEVASTLSKEIENNTNQMEEERKKKVVDINTKSDRERRLNYLVSTRKDFIEEFNQFLFDQMEYDNEDVYEDLNLEVTKKVEKIVEQEARLIVQPYIQQEVEEKHDNFNHFSQVTNTSKK